MKIATFNINDVNRRLPNLLRWLQAAEPDVVCLQELKATDAGFPEAAIRDAGYGAVWRGQKTWNGVAILARNASPVLIRDELPGDRDDTQSRYIEAAVNGVLVACIYLPNGNPQPGPKFDYKLAWFERLIAHAAELYAIDVPAVLAGDYNVVPTTRTSTRPSPGRRMRCCSPRAGRPFGAFWTRAGPMRSARFIPRSRCTRSGTTSGTAGGATPGSGSTTSC
jgi:exodeoxyribonuclease III